MKKLMYHENDVSFKTKIPAYLGNAQQPNHNNLESI